MGKKGGLFRYADGVDKLLMVFGTLGSIGDGLMTPLTMFVLSRVINEYGAATLTFSNDIVDKVSDGIPQSYVSNFLSEVLVVRISFIWLRNFNTCIFFNYSTHSSCSM